MAYRRREPDNPFELFVYALLVFAGLILLSAAMSAIARKIEQLMG